MQYKYSTGTDMEALLNPNHTLQGWKVHTWHTTATSQKLWGGIEEVTIRHHILWEREGDEVSNGSAEPQAG